MNRRVRTIAAVSAVALLLGGGAIAAVTATGRRTSPSARAHRAHVLSAQRSGGRDMSTASAYLGVPAPALRAQLRAGRSLADVARANKQSEEGLVTAIVASMKREIDSRLQGGAISSERAHVMLAHLEARVRALVRRSFPSSASN